jgi:aspartyl-tRNA(Asn)/glutamyl-tRNA(Gln) amidotransferase subunit B
MSPNLEAIIGLEVHAQMSTKTKMFCSCDNNAWDKEPNTTVCPICMGHPGTLPVPNEKAVEKAVRASLAIGCTVASDCHFDRKHYFYPDLPSGYQISQYDFPLAKGGEVAYALVDSSGKNIGEKVCGITRLHMENDAGKLTHRGNITLCDYNRAGTPLMEIVTEPDLRSADEAVAFAQELRRILVAVDASNADMFKGEMRFDASISLREVGTSKLNPRSEIKNLNSFKALEKALMFEEKRLRDAWEETGGPLKGNITVGWQDDKEETRMLRDKEDAQDYRYFPEPDIPPLHFEKKDIDKVKKALPELPRSQRKKYADLGLDEAQAMQLMDDEALRSIFDAVYEKTNDAKRTSGIVLTQLLGALKAANKNVSDGPDSGSVLELVAEIDSGTISGNSGKEVLIKMVETGKPAKEIIEAGGMKQISDDGALGAIVDAAIAANERSVADYKAGKQAALGALVGWIMKETKGQANPAKVNELLRSKLQ